MLYGTHALVAEGIAGEDPLIIAGSAISDISLLYGEVEIKELHSKGLEFYNWIKARDARFLPFAKGLMLHGNTRTGLDFYSHLRYDGKELGYAFIIGEGLVEQLNSLKIPFVGMKMVEVAHTVVEAAVEWWVVKDNPEIVDTFEDAVKEIDAGVVSNHLSAFFGGRISKEDIKDYYKRFSPNRFQTLKGATECYLDTIKRFLSKKIERQSHGIVNDVATKELFEKVLDTNFFGELISQAVRIVEPSYENFLTESTKSMAAEMRKLNLL